MSTALYRLSKDDIPAVALTDKVIVLDLDQTLVATQDDEHTLKTLGIMSNPKLMELRNRTYYLSIEDLQKPGVGSKYNFWGIIRPHTYEFLTFCFSYFKIVAVWSAGKRKYVEAIVDYLFRDLPSPHVMFTQDDITTGPGGHVEKPLTKMIESNPVLRHYMSLANTFALDDNSMTFHLNPGNGVLIPAYEPKDNVDAMSRDDHALLQFKYWLQQPEVMQAPDVNALDKSKIFVTSVAAYKQSAAGTPLPRFTA